MINEAAPARKQRDQLRAYLARRPTAYTHGLATTKYMYTVQQDHPGYRPGHHSRQRISRPAFTALHTWRSSPIDVADQRHYGPSLRSHGESSMNASHYTGYGHMSPL